MKAYYWPLAFRCLDCSTKLKLTEVLAASDGDFKVSGFCPKCPKDENGKYIHFTFTTDWTRIQKYCTDCDQSVEEGPKPLRPPLALPPGLSEEDLSFLKDFHITDELGGT